MAVTAGSYTCSSIHETKERLIDCVWWAIPSPPDGNHRKATMHIYAYSLNARFCITIGDDQMTHENIDTIYVCTLSASSVAKCFTALYAIYLSYNLVYVSENILCIHRCFSATIAQKFVYLIAKININANKTLRAVFALDWFQIQLFTSPAHHTHTHHTLIVCSNFAMAINRIYTLYMMRVRGDSMLCDANGFGIVWNKGRKLTHDGGQGDTNMGEIRIQVFVDRLSSVY